MDVTAMIATAKSTRGLFLALTALGLSTYKWPTHVPVEDKAEYDYVVVGAGTAGSIVANRLSEDPNVNVLLIEAGGDPHWEAEYASLFPYLTKSQMDWNYTSVDDGYSAQYHRNKYLDLPSGKVLGGSSTLHHFYYVRGDPYDYKLWADATGDESWNWWNLLPFFKKSERLVDPEIINSETASFHGMDGAVAITRETRNQPLKYLEAFGDVGHKIMVDMNTNDTLGFAHALFTIDENGIRQSSAECYLATAKHRPNLHIMKNTMVTKVLFDGINAIGVEATSSEKLINIYAKREVILSAGAFNTPKILMLSGVGPQDHLDSLNIPVVKDLPVGKTLQDHAAVIVAHKLEQTSDPVETQPPWNFPVPTFVGSGALDKEQGYSDWVTLNLICRNNPAALLQLSSVVFGLHDDVCNQLAAAGTESEVLFTVMNKARPLSYGNVALQSSDPEDPPVITTGHFSNSVDLENNAAYILDYIKVKESSFFKSVGAETIYFDLPKCNSLDRDSIEYWKCYTLHMMDTTFHYSSSCRMGSVLDSRLRVLGINNLRVGDASAMPNQVTGNINTAVMVIAEKLADMIIKDNSE
ncbi:glucose dehydrogenase [FAD, quinone]-like [Pararge aegeria]|uniref:glucose dehydrogenase [FAD, quinone]-like n=1 Tax=Pararge aegeria TaxID=116150 RepID=UPI0019D1312A|nr:glucose dehydrogenase [FAD, quinone]-like [Pararge aegeria]